jgi:hypothetical protein
MAELNFSTDELLEQAKGNETGLWHACVLWAKQQPGGIDAWASFVGQAFAPGWDEMGNASALDVARVAGLNFATTADMRPVDVTGDESRAVLTLAGPAQDVLDEMGTNVEDIDRSNEVLFSVIAERRGLTVSAERSADTLRLTFARME